MKTKSNFTFRPPGNALPKDRQFERVAFFNGEHTFAARKAAPLSGWADAVGVRCQGEFAEGRRLFGLARIF